MSFEPPAGILDIGNATLRVGKLEVAETSGLNQGLQNIVKNDLLVTEKNESSPYTTNQKWGLKLPTAWVGEFEVKGQTGKYVEFNFYNEGSTSNAQGYTLNFKDTSLTLKYDNGNTLATATIPTIIGTFRKVNIFFERGVIAVSIDGIRYLYHKESDTFNQGLGVASRVVSTTGGAFVNVFFESDHGGNSQFKNLRIVNGRFISDKTSNVSFIGSLGVGVNNPKESLDIRGNMHLTRVSNVSQISVDSNVVTEYTGPHDRPLRKYPEVTFPTQATGDIGDTTVTYKGYTLTSSTTYNYINHNLTNVLDGLTNTTWSGNLGNYTTAGVPQSTTRGGLGDYVQLELPNAIKIQHTKIFSQETAGYSNGPRDITLYGSHNGTDWTSIKVATELPLNGEALNATVHVNSMTFYRYFRLEINKIWIDSGNATYPRIAEWELYGYEEGSGSLDTTLKTVYNVPATTGTQLEVYYDGQDYSEVTSTVTDKVGNSNSTITSGSDITFDSTWKAWTFSNNMSRTQTFRSGTLPTSLTSSTSISAAVWFKFGTTMGDRTIFHIADPQANRTANEFLEIRANVDQEYRFQLWDGEYTWRFNPPFFNQKSDSIPTGEWYHLAMSITDSSVTGRKLYFNGVECDLIDGSRLTAASASELNLPSDAVLELGRRPGDGVGNTVHDAELEFDGSIANFRLYSKALNAGQIQELYDYQKDYFLGSKSQVTLYKGHLGVGVTEPSGQLELAGDERLQEYPPGPLTNYETHIPGHGVFCWDTPYYYKGSFETHSGVGMYAKDEGTTGWYGPYQGNSGYTGGDVYSGTDFTASTTSGLFFDDAYGNRYHGAWTTFKLPYKINLKRLRIRQWGSAESVNSRCAPEDGVILGSNDGAKWYHVHTFAGLQYGGSAGSYSFSAVGEYVTINCNTDYNQYVLITTKTLHYAFTVIIGELQWFGTPGPTTLDKGSLSLTRSLDVPRVSRYDVDTETPRPEKLVLDLDTTVNSSPTDISGKGNHGKFVGTAQYSSADKAFVFDGNSDYITVADTSASGNWAHSFSFWFKPTSDNLNGLNLYGLGNITGGGHASLLYIYTGTNATGTDPTLRVSLYGDGQEIRANQLTIQTNRWYHMTVTNAGGVPTSDNCKMYVDGVQYVTFDVDSGGGGFTDSLNLAAGTLDIGRQRNYNGGYFPGQISNFKLYNTVLESSEVKKLYNLGRTGRSMVISDTAVGIGKAPEAQLDVRGNIAALGAISSNNPAWCYWKTGSPDQNDIIYNSATDGPVTFNSLQSFGQNWETGVAGTSTARGTGRNFEPSTGTYTAPEKGVYLVQFCWSMEGGDGGDDSQYALFVTAGNDANGGSWESGGSFPNRTSNSSAYMLFNPQFSTRGGVENVWCISDLILLDKGSTVQVWFKNVSSVTTLEVIRANFSGIKIA